MITIEKLLDMGLHLGHSPKWMDSKMKPYICGKNNELQLLDLVQSYWFIKRACHFLMVAASQKKTFLFVSKKKFLAKKIKLANKDIRIHSSNDVDHNNQNSSFLVDQVDHRLKKGLSMDVHHREQDSAGVGQKDRNTFYVNQRWLGGLLTNWHTVRKCLIKLDTLEMYEKSGKLGKFSKKEVATWKRDFEKLQTNLGGLRGMTQLPDVVILLGQWDGGEAIKECKKLNIPTIQLLDTNSNPRVADLFVPVNDDCLTGLQFVITCFLKSIKKGTSLINREISKNKEIDRKFLDSTNSKNAYKKSYSRN